MKIGDSMKKYFFVFVFFFLVITVVKAENIDDNINNRCSLLGASCIHVKNTEEVIKAIDDIYTIKDANEYHLVYTYDEYLNIDFEKVMEYYKTNYIVDLNKNIYKYVEYAYFQPNRYLPNYSDSELIIDAYTLKTSREEEKKVDKFLKVLLPSFANLSPYEKILGAYSYINNTTNYIKDEGFFNFQEADLSAYDVFFKNKAVCISGATAFQLLMEKLGIESYIIDHVVSNTDDNYASTHTYNVVKLDEVWYIVDIKFDRQLTGFLIGNEKKMYDKNDFKYLNLEISSNSYFDKYPDANKNFEFDYETLSLALDRIDNNIENIEEENITIENDLSKELKKNYLKEYIIIIVILVIIFLIIWKFTRKPR